MARHPKRHRWWQRLVVTLSSLALALLLLLAFLFRTQPGRNVLAGWLSSMLSGVAGGEVRLDGLKGKLPGELRLVRLRVADTQGEWLDVHDAYLHWRPWDLLKGEVTAYTVGARALHVERLPSRAMEGDDVRASAPPPLERVRIERLSVDTLSVMRLLEEARLDGSLQLAFSPLGMDGEVVVSNQTMAGTARFESTRNGQALAVSLAGCEPVWGAGCATSASLDARVSDLFHTPQVKGRARVAGLEMGGLYLDRLKVTTEGSAERMVLTLDAAGRLDGEELLATGRVVMANSGAGRAIVVDRLEAELGPYRAANLNELRLVEAAEAWRLEPFHLLLDEQLLSAEAAGQHGAWNVDAWLPSVGLASLPWPESVRAAGYAGLGLHLRSAGPEVEGRLGMAMVDGRLFQGDAPDPEVINLAGKAVLEGGILEGGLGLAGDGGDRFSVDLTLPVRWRWAPWSVAVQGEQGVRAALRCDMSLAVLNLLPQMMGQGVGGRLVADLHWKDTGDGAPLAGTCAIHEGRYDQYALGLTIRELEAAFRMQGNRLVLDKATATDGGDGHLGIRGEWALSPAEGLPFQFEVAAEQAAVVQRDDLAAAASGKLEVEGDRRQVKVKGALDIPSGELRVENLAGGGRGPEVVPFEEVGVPPAGSREEPEKPARLVEVPMAVALDLAITVPDSFSVRGEGLISTWGGELHAVGEKGQLSLTGDLQSRRGTYTFLGRPFKLTRGELRLDGALPPAPTMDIEAEYSRREVTVRLSAVGRLDEPRIGLESTPPMPTDEIMSVVLFGSDSKELSPIQTLSLAKTIGQVTEKDGGLKKSKDLVGEAREVLGVDELSLRENDDVDSRTEVVAGKRIAEDVYVEVGSSLGSGGGRVLVEYEVTRHLTIETDAGAQMRPGVGLSWKLDY